MNPAAILVLIAAFFSIFWIGIMWLLAHLSGWNTWHELYPDRLEPPRVSIGWQTAGMGGDRGGRVSYNRCLKLGLCHSGLRISIWPLLGLFHPPFMLPWTDITAHERKLMMLRYVELSFGRNGVNGKMILSERTFARIAADSPLRLA